MSRMKTFFIYFLIFVGFYILSNILINAYIKTSYYKIKSYDIDVKDATITIMTAKASKDDGYIEGKIYNNTEEEINNKYMKIELFSKNNVNLGKKYIKIEKLKPNEINDFKITFTYDNVTYFKITLLTQEEKQAEEDNQKNNEIFNFQIDPEVEKITNDLKVN